MLKSEALECTLLTIPHTCMYDTYKASYKLSKLTVTDTQTDTPTDICTPRAAFAAENGKMFLKFFNTKHGFMKLKPILENKTSFDVDSAYFQNCLATLVDRLLTCLTAQQKGTSARWHSNKTSLSNF